MLFNIAQSSRSPRRSTRYVLIWQCVLLRALAKRNRISRGFISAAGVNCDVPARGRGIEIQKAEHHRPSRG